MEADLEKKLTTLEQRRWKWQTDRDLLEFSEKENEKSIKFKNENDKND